MALRKDGTMDNFEIKKTIDNEIILEEDHIKASCGNIATGCFSLVA